MLKKYEHTHSYFHQFLMQWFFKTQTKLSLFWSFWQINFVNPTLILFFIKRRYFFFKFLQFKIHKEGKKHPNKKKNRKHNHLEKINKQRLITWFVDKNSTYLNFKGVTTRRYIWPNSTKRWIRRFIRKQRLFRIRRRFLRQLSRRILKSQLFAGRLLFNIKSRKNLKRFFQLFRGANNNPTVNLQIINRFFFLYVFNRFRWSRSRLFNYITLNSSNLFTITYFNLQSFFFKKMKIKLRKLKKKSKKIRSFFKKRRIKKSKRKYYKWISSHNFIFKRRYQKYFPRTIIYFKDMLTQTYTFSKVNRPALNFYLFYIINIWNIRSYNWRQVT